MPVCEKKFVYEVLAPSILYLTIDDNDPIFVGFQHKIKLEVCSTCNDNQDKKDDQNSSQGITRKSMMSQPNLKVREQQKLSSLKPQTLFTEEIIPSVVEKKKSESLVLLKDDMGRGKRRKSMLSDFQEVEPILKRSRRMLLKAQQHTSLVTEKEEQLEEQKEKLKTFRVNDVGWKSEKLRASRANMIAIKKDKLDPDSNTAETISENIISCKFCFKAFATKEDFFNHHKIIKPLNHVCHICNASFPFQAYLFVHMRNHTVKKSDIYKCDTCGLDTKNSTGMKRHMIKHTNEKCYKCCICGKESFDFGTSKVHLLTHHKPNKKGNPDPQSGSQSHGLGLIVVKKPGQEVNYTCLYCAQTFPSKQEFFNHTRIVSKQTYSCEICGAKFALRAFLLAHMKTHQDKSSDKLYVCDDCGLAAKTPTRLKRHMLTHTFEKCYKCCVCLKESPYYGTAKLHLMTHEKKVHPAPELQLEEAVIAMPHGEMKAGRVFCDICNQTFKTKKDLINHNKIFNPLTHKCEDCGTAFPYRAYLLVHMKTHGMDKQNGTLYKCDECGLNTKNTTRLKRHMITHTKEQCYKCCICPKTSSCFSTAQKHLMFHRRHGMLRCTCCNTDFLNRQALAKHQLEVMDIKCELCGQEFPNRTSRTLHLKSEHSHQIFNCNTCFRVYTNQTEFDNHMAYHENNKKKQCPVCGKFVSRLDKHLLSHRSIQEMDESELWMCHKCPNKFKLKSSFIRHLASHSDERNFHCHLCSKAFTSGSELGRHLRRHSSLTPHQCLECGKWFRERRNLKCHMLVHSDSKVFQCTICPLGFHYKSSLEAHMRSKRAVVTEHQQYVMKSPAVMAPPDQANTSHRALAQDLVAPSVIPFYATAPMVQFSPEVSNWHN